MTHKELFDYGVMVFNGDVEMFFKWSTKPVMALGMKVPEYLWHSQEGREQVMGCLQRLEHGNLA